MLRTLTKWIFIIGVVFYGVLHVVAASAPVQRRLFEEVRRALLEYGLDLQIESMQFSAFVPRVYLNRVTIGTTPKAPVQFPTPLQIDKIKVQIQPLGLLQKRIIISEATLFHPKIYIPQADALYKKLKRVLETQSKISMEGSNFQVEFKKLGIVDALFQVQSADPPFSIRSRSLSAFLRQDSVDQQNISVSSNNLEVTRQKLEVNFENIDVDVDVSAKSLRVNKGHLVGQDFNIQVKGATALPTKSKPIPDSFHGNYDLKLALRYLNDIPELGAPFLEGIIASSGNIKAVNGNYNGSGGFHSEKIGIQGNKLGDSQFQYGFEGKKLELHDFKVTAAGGEMTTSSVLIKLEAPYPVASELKIKGLELQDLLVALKEVGDPITMRLDGGLRLKGQLAQPFSLNTQLDGKIANLLVLQDLKKAPEGENKIISVKSGEISGELNFTKDQMAFNAEIGILKGKAKVDGVLGFGSRAEVRVKASELSLTELHDIAELEFRGTTDLEAEISADRANVQVRGEFQTQKSELAGIILGSVHGKAFYEDGLLSFEELSRSATEPIRGFGFVDFKPKHSHYKFDITARKAGIDEVFGLFGHLKLDFPVPVGGETNARVRIEGGHDEEGIELIATGQARGFEWYGEKWLSSTYSLTYRPKATELSRAMLVKRSGGLEVRGHFDHVGNSLSLISRGLRVEELNIIGKSPLQGEIVGSVRLKGDFFRPSGEGNLQLINSYFRGNKLEDSSVMLSTVKDETVLRGNLLGERLRGRLTHSDKGHKDDELLLVFKSFDITPVLSFWLGKDLPAVGTVLATGDISLKNVLNPSGKISGSGTFSDLGIGFRGNPMRNEDLVQFKVEQGALSVDKFRLVGPQGQLAVEYSVNNKGLVSGSADGKLDLQHIQPFVPGLEYGLGKVSVGLRMSGTISQYNLLGNIQVEDSVFRITGLEEEYRNANVLLTLSQDRINVDRFDAQLGGGTVKVSGDIRINKFRTLSPNLSIQASKVQLKLTDALQVKLNGDFGIKGVETPYAFFGKCKVIQSRLSSFNVQESMTATREKPVFNFDIRCEAKDQVLVQTDVMDAEFKGSVRVMGNTNKIGLLGELDALKGSIIFKETKFNLETGGVRFEDSGVISPRFNVVGRALVKEETGSAPQSYDVNLQVFGTPKDYKIRLGSVPQLSEPELISLLILGVTSRSQEGNYVDFGTTVMGPTPFQTKLQDELGLDVKVSAQKSSNQSVPITPGVTGGDTTVPSVKVQKEVTKKTKVSVSNTIEDTSLKEFKIEHMLNDSFTVNAARTEKNKGASQEPSASYGVDFRYRFNFE